ncbi:MAG TPA: hypothetical protein PKC45_04890 [Gemmatales bacterium]|mgnify:FL=1|nr:hypothetical protein [Gemmatales bacterium]
MLYQIHGTGRRCARTGRELRPGERIFSVLYDRAGQWEREDVAAEAWSGPPPGAFSFWQTRVPDDAEGRRPRLDDEMARDLFQRLENTTEERQLQTRYVLALWLMRRKLLRFEEVQRTGEQDWLVLRDVRQRRTVRVLDPHLTEESMAEVQGQIEELLGG